MNKRVRLASWLVVMLVGMMAVSGSELNAMNKRKNLISSDPGSPAAADETSGRKKTRRRSSSQGTPSDEVAPVRPPLSYEGVAADMEKNPGGAADYAVQKIDHAFSHIDKKRNLLRRYKELVARLREKLGCRKKSDSTESFLDRVIRKSESNDSEVARLKEEIETLRTKNEDLLKKNSDMERALALLGIKNSWVEAAERKLRDDDAAKSEADRKHDEVLRELQLEVDRLKRELQSAGEQESSLKDEIQTLRDENAGLRQKFAELLRRVYQYNIPDSDSDDEVL